jgi:hypothetical protein
MTLLTIYMEGGGNSGAQKTKLGRGMEQFLVSFKEKLRAKNGNLRVTPRGTRQAAYDAFVNARRWPEPGEIIILLVDSEAAVAACDDASAHLRKRQGDGWDLRGVSIDHIHLMAQTMEAWLVADPEALASYYGQHFHMNALPVRDDLEEESKIDCANKLAAATRPTQKGEYQKIRHAADLLGRISPDKVRKRCPRAEIMFSTLTRLIE